jgi:hypothetical protein
MLIEDKRREVKDWYEKHYRDHNGLRIRIHPSQLTDAKVEELYKAMGTICDYHQEFYSTRTDLRDVYLFKCGLEAAKEK